MTTSLRLSRCTFFIGSAAKRKRAPRRTLYRPEHEEDQWCGFAMESCCVYTESVGTEFLVSLVVKWRFRDYPVCLEVLHTGDWPCFACGHLHASSAVPAVNCSEQGPGRAPPMQSWTLVSRKCVRTINKVGAKHYGCGDTCVERREAFWDVLLFRSDGRPYKDCIVAFSVR